MEFVLGLITGIVITVWWFHLFLKSEANTTKSFIYNRDGAPLEIDGVPYVNVSKVTIETTQEVKRLTQEYADLTIVVEGDVNGALSLTQGHVIVKGNSEDVRVVTGTIEVTGSCSRIETMNGNVNVGGTCRGDVRTVYSSRS